MYKIFFSIIFLIYSDSVLGATSENIIVKSAWVRPSHKDKNTALYLEIDNNSDQVIDLLKASTDVASEVQLHDTQKNGDIAGMHHINLIPCGAHDTTKFKPGGEHIMLMHLKHDLKVGQNIPVTLTFSDSSGHVIKVIKIEAPVKTSECDCNCE